MKKLLPTVPVAALLFFCFCDNPGTAGIGNTGDAPVMVRGIAKAQASSTYRIIITGPGMAQIGPDEYAGGQTIELYVPKGKDRSFHFERYNEESVLTDTCTTVSDIIGSGMNTITVSLISALSTYTVTYDGNGETGGSLPSAQTKTQGDTLTLSGNTGSLVKTGYTFDGWNTADDGSGTDYAVGASYTADANVMLFAKWTSLPTYTVTYDGNGETGGSLPSAQTKTQGDTLTLSGNTGSLVKTGYTFAGWNTADDGSGTDYAVGASYTADANVTLYAKWTSLPTYTVTYDGNEETGGSLPSAQIKTQGDTLTLSGNTGSLVKTGYTFAGWNTADDGGGTDYAVGASYTADANVTLYAKWTALPTYTVAYDGNGETGGSLPAAQIKTQGDTLTLSGNTGSLVKTGYTFAGWNTADDGSGTDYAVSASYTPDANVTLYAKWTSLPTYTVTYDGNEETGGSLPSAQTKTQGDTLTLWGNTGSLAKTGYTFAGWNTADDGSGTDYAAGASYTPDANVTLYARWTPLPTYTVTYDGNGETGGSLPSAQTKTQGDTLTLSGNTGSLEKTGYTFDGWNTADDGSGTDYAAGASYTADANVTLYAKWESNGSGIVAGPTVTDANGNVYTSIVIGTQTWTVQNLRTTKYNDGTPIAKITDNSEWANDTSGAYCYYENDSASYAETYGALYNWYAVNTGKLAPEGWHVPTDAEWDTLQNYLIANGYNWDDSTSGNKIGKALASDGGEWNSNDEVGNVGNDQDSNNSTGFSALPGGYRFWDGGFGNQINRSRSLWWSATEFPSSSAYARGLNYYSEGLYRSDDHKRHGFSVRLVRD